METKQLAKNFLTDKPATALIIGFLVLGGASATILSNFAVIDSTADTTQAIVVGGSSGSSSLSTTQSIVAGDYLVYGTSLTNNQDEALDLQFTTTSDPEIESVEYLTVDDIYTVERDYDGDGTVESNFDAEFTFNDDTNRTSIHVNGSVNGDLGAGKVAFDVADQPFDGSNTVTVTHDTGPNHDNVIGSTNEQAPDWIIYEVTSNVNLDTDLDGTDEIVKGEKYLVGDYTVDEPSGTTVSWSASDSFGGNNNPVFDDKSNPLPSVSPSDLRTNSTINRLLVGSGSRNDQNTIDIYYNQITFNGNKAITTLGTGNFTTAVSTGSQEFAVVGKTNTSIMDGQYSINTEVSVP